jgi:uncharacterized membrane protein YbaN (DUF454 family)
VNGDQQSSSVLRALWFAGGLGALALGALGVALPLLPTTPFVLLAAYAFARSSQRWHNWLLNHRVFGPMIANWRHHGAIDRRAKVASVISMVGIFLLSLALSVSPPVLAVQAIALTGAGAFVLSRPSPPDR